LKQGRVAPLRNPNSQRAAGTFRLVVFGELGAEFASLAADDAVGAWVVRGWPVVDLDADPILVNFVAPARKRLAHAEFEETAQFLGTGKQAAGEDAL
jgi:hypothetical protein